jgi:hypothetical protein
MGTIEQYLDAVAVHLGDVVTIRRGALAMAVRLAKDTELVLVEVQPDNGPDGSVWLWSAYGPEELSYDPEHAAIGILERLAK